MISLTSFVDPESKAIVAMTRLPHWSRLFPLAIGLTIMSGCGDSASPVKVPNTETKAVTTVVTIPDDPAAVAALEKAGCRLTKNGDGVVTEIAVSSDTDIGDALKNLAGIPNTTVARFGGPGMNDAAMKALAGLKVLKRLDLTDCSSIGDGTLQIIGELKTIEVLILRRAGFTDAGLVAVRNLPRLRALDVRNSNVTDAGLEHLAGMRTLVDLQLEKAKLTDAGLEKLRGLPLKSLNLNYTGVGDAAMPVIGSLATLESLQMEASRITDAGMVELAKLKKLKRFGCRLANVSGEGIRHLAGLTELNRLELRETSLDDDGLEVISHLKKLTFLDISECRLLTGDGIRKLSRLTRLTYLELRELRKVRDDVFAELGTLTNLLELNAEATRITNESVPTLLKLQKLERLSVAGSQLDDAGIVQLSQLPALKWLNLSNSNPNPETIASLKAARPDLEIVE